jgi:sugar lactone lactonase YvrE
VQRLAADGAFLSAIGRKGDAAGDLALPKGVAVDASGNIWIADAQFENIQAFTPDGKLLMGLGREGNGVGEFWLPSGLCIDATNRLWVADSYNRRVQVFQLL